MISPVPPGGVYSAWNAPLLVLTRPARLLSSMQQRARAPRHDQSEDGVRIESDPDLFYLSTGRYSTADMTNQQLDSISPGACGAAENSKALRVCEGAQAASSQPHVAVAAGNHETVSRTLHIQAAKVVAAHAASIGDALLGVPLLCSAGLPQEGVAALQEAGLWRYAATLTAHTLKGDE